MPGLSEANSFGGKEKQFQVLVDDGRHRHGGGRDRRCPRDGGRGAEVSELSKSPFAVGLSRQSRRIIRQNLLLSLGVIALLVPSTLLGVASIGIAVLFH